MRYPNYAERKKIRGECKLLRGWSYKLTPRQIAEGYPRCCPPCNTPLVGHQAPGSIDVCWRLCDVERVQPSVRIAGRAGVGLPTFG